MLKDKEKRTFYAQLPSLAFYSGNNMETRFDRTKGTHKISQ